MRTYSSEEIKTLCADKRVLVVACEAGAAQILAALAAKLRLSNADYVVEGPAVRVFNGRLGTIATKTFQAIDMHSYGLVLTGTSLVPDLERKVIQSAKVGGVRVCSIVDHWVNYRQRFTEVGGQKNEAQWPDEIWLTDEAAWETAIKEGLPEDRLRLIDNYYFEALEGKSWPTEAGRLLYVCEPVFDDVKLLTGDGNAWGYNEFDLVKDFLGSLEAVNGAFKKAVLRLHPNESRSKYDALLKVYCGPVEVEVSTYELRSIEEECARAEVIVGVESMGLAIGLYFGRTVFSCLPAKANKQCQLPHKGIRRIHSVSEIAGIKVGGQ